MKWQIMRKVHLFSHCFYFMKEMLSEEVNNKQAFNSLKVTKAKSSVSF